MRAISITAILIPFAAYLLGSIPFGLLVAKLFGGADLRKTGSGNIGATNVARVVGPLAGVLTLVFDTAKGAGAVWLAGRFTEEGATWMMVAAFAVLLGHCFPVWLKFKGGKGVAVYIGVLIGLFWPAAIVFCVVWAATAATSRYSSLSALVASFVTPIFLWWFGHSALASLFAVLTLLVFYVHRENIRRLQAGTEGRIGEK